MALIIASVAKRIRYGHLDFAAPVPTLCACRSWRSARSCSGREWSARLAADPVTTGYYVAPRAAICLLWIPATTVPARDTSDTESAKTMGNGRDYRDIVEHRANGVSG